MAATSAIHELKGSDTVVRVDGYWLRHYATDFLSAAKAFEAPKSGRFSPVPYFLICRSIELSLKAFLFSAGFKKEDRKRLNHNLEKALNAAEKNGLRDHLDIAPDELAVLVKANRLYPKKEFEYFESLETIYDPHDFEIGILSSFAEKLLKAIEAPVQSSIFER